MPNCWNLSNTNTLCKPWCWDVDKQVMLFSLWSPLSPVCVRTGRRFSVDWHSSFALSSSACRCLRCPRFVFPCQDRQCQVPQSSPSVQAAWTSEEAECKCMFVPKLMWQCKFTKRGTRTSVKWLSSRCLHYVLNNTYLINLSTRLSSLVLKHFFSESSDVSNQVHGSVARILFTWSIPYNFFLYYIWCSWSN